MVTVYIAAGLRFVIYLDDHKPAHVHVYGDGEAKVNLVGGDGGPELVSKFGMKKGDARRAMKIIAEQQAFLLEKWEEIHG